MEYINEINIMEATIHVLDNNADEPILNEYLLQLTEEVYEFVFKHVQRSLRDDELRYAVFNHERNIVKEVAKEYLSGECDLVRVSKELARQMFILMRSKGNIPSCDLLTVGFTTEHGPFIGIFKMDYIKNYMHNVEFVEDNIGINLIPQFTGLPSSSAKIQKCAFIRPFNSENKYDLLVIDKQKKSNKDSEDYGANYFMDNYLGCKIITNDRDNTKNFLRGTENFIQRFVREDAETAEMIRREIREKITHDDEINLEEVASLMGEGKEGYLLQMAKSCDNEFKVDKHYVDKKLKRIRLKVDKDIDIYLNQESYNDRSKFEVVRNGDGSINMVIKNIMNYAEK
ncbi:nucleoid-associated protein [Clostridium culturomicium]|uniref:nucleoid-associated protein n=1 Tax=Clostridium culturomicium TaxID=1499683 RepID=UPI00058B2F75|nr:nucleoid-associated protein [Clostridium culturomicium]